MENDILIELTNKNEDSSGFQFVLRAMIEKPGEDTRCFAHCIKIKDGEIIGTDGIRCHTYTAIETYRNGFYRVLKRLKTHVILLKVSESDYKKPFPETDKFFQPGSDDPMPIIADLFDYNYVKSYCEIIRKMPIWQIIRPDHVEDLDGHFEAFIRKDNVLFIGENRKACLSVKQDVEHHD